MKEREELSKEKQSLQTQIEELKSGSSLYDEKLTQFRHFIYHLSFTHGSQEDGG